MRKGLIFWMGVMCLPWCAVYARVNVKAELTAKTFLLYEPIRLRITIENESNDELQLGGTTANSRFFFQVTNVRNQMIPRTEMPLLEEAWRIPPGATDSRTFNLTRLFALRRKGDYRLITSIQLPEESKKDRPKLFEISEGTRLQEVKNRSEDRAFELFLLNRNDQNQLLLRVSDYAGSRVIRTYFLGRYLRFYPPEFKKARDGSLAVLHYEQPERLLFSRFHADGSPIAKQTLNVKSNERVRLEENGEDGFVVRGAGGEPLEDFVMPDEEE